jgi:uncharacterized protein (TIRG00374 family)
LSASPRRRWLLTALRIGLCLAAIAYLAFNVKWYDYVRLESKDGPLARLVGQSDGQFRVLRDSQIVTVPASEVFHEEVKGQRVPEIEYGIHALLHQLDGLQAFWAIMLFLPVPLLSAVRLVWMMRVQQVRLSLWNSTKLTFAGNFFNFAMPGGMTGGDVIKAYYVTRFTQHKTEAVTTIFLDRVVGLIGLVLMSGTVVLLTHESSHFSQLKLPLAAIVGGLVVSGAMVYSRRVRQALRLRQIVDRLPLAAQLQRIGQATLAMRSHKLLVTSSLLITFALQGTCIVSATIMAWAIGMQGSFDYFFIYIAVGFLIAAVPISPPQAIGVMESFYVWCFTADGLNTASQAFALAVAVRLIQLVWALPGVLVPLLGAHLPRRAELLEIEQMERGSQLQAPAAHREGEAPAQRGTVATEPREATRPGMSPASGQ